MDLNIPLGQIPRPCRVVGTSYLDPEEVVRRHPGAGLGQVHRRFPDRAVRAAARRQGAGARSSGPGEIARDDRSRREARRAHPGERPPELLQGRWPDVAPVPVGLEEEALAAPIEIDAGDPAVQPAGRCPSGQARCPCRPQGRQLSCSVVSIMLCRSARGPRPETVEKHRYIPPHGRARLS